MIFITVGTHEFSFKRLVQAGDDLAARIQERITIQRGHTPYLPSFAESFEWATGREIEAWMQEARVVITHAGAGSILQALKLGKPLIIVPRLKKYNESYNDHQRQLAIALHRRGRAVMLEEVNPDTLLEAIEQVAGQGLVEPPVNSLARALRLQLEIWNRERK